MSQADLAATTNVGVVGFGGDGPKAVTVGGSAVGPVSAGAGIRGIGGVAAAPGTSVTLGGPGVVGVAGGVTVPADATVAEIGVAGFGGPAVNVGIGVLGVSSSSPGVSGTSTSAAGVAGSSTSAPGVAATSSSGVGVSGSSAGSNGGWFRSGTVAQIHLEPLRDPLVSPQGVIPGVAGDLLVLTPRGERVTATLWFCTTTGEETTAQWVNIA